MTDLERVQLSIVRFDGERNLGLTLDQMKAIAEWGTSQRAEEAELTICSTGDCDTCCETRDRAANLRRQAGEVGENGR